MNHPKPRDDRRRLLRAADTIRTQLAAHRRFQRTEAFSRLRVLLDGLAELSAIGRRFALANQRGLTVATERQVAQAARQVRYLSGQLAETQRMLDECDRNRVPALRQVIADLEQTEEEFAQPLRFDASQGTLCLATEPVELDGLYLGNFDVCLDVRELARMRANHLYRIVALDPHPAGGADHVTHPHVSHETLCEGDASMAIRSALMDGRVWDFYCLINGVLTTYNEESPYVRLDEWHGVTCHDCGERMDGEDLYTCEHCEERYCPDCFTWCRVCDRDGCFGCPNRCDACNSLVCSDCVTACDACGGAVCDNCRIPCRRCGSRLCDACVTSCDRCDGLLCGRCVDDGRCADCREGASPAEGEPDRVPASAGDVSSAATTAPSTEPYPF